MANFTYASGIIQRLFKIRHYDPQHLHSSTVAPHIFRQDHNDSQTQSKGCSAAEENSWQLTLSRGSMAQHDQQDLTHFDRKFSKSLIGDFTFDIQRLRERRKFFLQRNLRRFLLYHQALLATTPESRLFDLQAAETPKSTLRKELDPEQCPLLSVNGHHNSSSALRESFEAKPAREAVSRQCLCIRAMAPDFEAPDFEASGRRSRRKAQEQLYHHDDAELTINIVNVREEARFRH